MPATLVPVCYRVRRLRRLCRRSGLKRRQATTEFTAVQRAGACVQSDVLTGTRSERDRKSSSKFRETKQRFVKN